MVLLLVFGDGIAGFATEADIVPVDDQAVEGCAEEGA